MSLFLLSTLIEVHASDVVNCNTEDRQTLWSQMVHLPMEGERTPSRVNYPMQGSWTKAFPELGHLSYWSEKDDLAGLFIELEFTRKDSSSVLSRSRYDLKQLKDPDWKPNEGLKGYQGTVDFSIAVNEFLGEVEEGTVVLTVKSKDQTYCRHSISLSGLIDQEE